MKKNDLLIKVVGGLLVVAVVAVLVMTNRESPKGKAGMEVIRPVDKPVATAPKQVVSAQPDKPTQIQAKEIRYLPGNVSLEGERTNPLLKMPPLKEGSRRVVGVRKVSDKARDGHFLSPKWSPDGLQMLVSRPGYSGIYVIDARTGQMRFVADGSAYGASWTADGKIQVRDEDGNLKTIRPDGTVESVEPASASDAAFAENDTIFARGADGSAIPITASDDKYFNPVTSPDGKSVVYQGLTSGLYMAPADGSGEPVYIGRGNNPVWTPGSDGVVFDVTTDDGHYLTSGDLYYVDSDLSERTNLTPGSDSIDQMPTLSPDGREIAYESDGEIYVGELR